MSVRIQISYRFCFDCFVVVVGVVCFCFCLFVCFFVRKGGTKKYIMTVKEMGEIAA